MNRLTGLFLVCSLSIYARFAYSSTDWKWSLQNGFDGGEILSLAVGDGALLASSRHYGVYRSVDTGRSWQPMGTRPLRLHFLEFDSASHLFYGLGDSALFTAGPQAGEWTRLVDFEVPGFPPGHFSNPGYPAPAKFSVHGPVLILLPELAGGVKVSRDGGRTWRTTTSSALNFNSLNILAADSCVYASSWDNAVKISCDGGATWRFAGGDSTTRNGTGLARHGNAVLVSSAYGIFRSVNQGRTWTPWNGNLQNPVIPGENQVENLKHKGNILYASMRVDPTGIPDLFLYHSLDGGSHWTKVTEWGTRRPIVWSYTWFEAAELDAQIFLPSPRGVMRTTDGGLSWNRLRGLGDAGILSLAIHGRRTLALTDSGFFVTADSGNTWNAAMRNEPTATWIAMSGGTGLYAALSKQGGVRVSQDSGATWKAIPVPAPGPAKHLAALGRTLYLVAAGSLWRSGPDGAAWTQIPLPTADSIRLIAGGTRSLLLCAQSHVWEYREDAGFSNRGGTVPIYDISRAWLIGDNAYVFSFGELHRWEEPVGDWQKVAGYEGYPHSLTGLGSWLVIGTNAGPQVSPDLGRTWEKNLLVKENPQRNQLPWVFALDGNRLYAGDDAGGIWRLDPALPGQTTSIRTPPGRMTPRRVITGARSLLEAWRVRPDGRAFP